MNVVIAMDSFKGSLSSVEAGQAAAKAVLSLWPDAACTVLPMADGGEGTTEALLAGLGGRRVTVPVTGPDGATVTAAYGILPDGKTAVLECAEAAGLTLVPPQNRDAAAATTFGVGELLLDAYRRGCRAFLMGIGGSATSDGGTGMLSALGIRFLKADGTPVLSGVRELDQISEISSTKAEKELLSCSFSIACDVTNPLCGSTGAIAVYGPQKGIPAEQVDFYDQKMKHYAAKTAAFCGEDRSGRPGAGAAGGLGFAFLSYFPHAKLLPGIECILEATGAEAAFQQADLVLTGEGRLDAQSAMGKVPVGVAACAKKYQVPVLAFVGCLGEGAEAVLDHGITAFYAVQKPGQSTEEAMQAETAKQNIIDAVSNVLSNMTF